MMVSSTLSGYANTIASGTSRCTTLRFHPRTFVAKTLIITTLLLFHLVSPTSGIDSDIQWSTTDNNNIQNDTVGRFSSVLSSLYHLEVAKTSDFTTLDANGQQTLNSLNQALQVDANGYVPLEIVAVNKTMVINVLQQAEQIGFVKKLVYEHILSGKVSILTLPNLTQVANIVVIRPNLRIRNAGSLQSEAVQTLNVDDLRKRHPKVDGRGLKMGVMSDTFDCLGGAQEDVMSGDLPAGAVVLEEGPCSDGIDEGRAMMQLIYDIAPGAKLLFYAVLDGQSEFASGIDVLVAAGCDVIVDDILNFYEPMFQDGIIAQAVDREVNNGVAFFSAAGNYASSSYSAPYNFSGTLFQVWANCTNGIQQEAIYSG
jgi:hypothetical protein